MPEQHLHVMIRECDELLYRKRFLLMVQMTVYKSYLIPVKLYKIEV